MDIYTYLKKDHRNVSELMEQVLRARSTERRDDLLEEIRQELLLHAETEQATFYAVLDEEPETKENITEAKEEHAEIKQYLARLSSMSAASEKWMELFGEFKHAVEHHVHEEEDIIFKKARAILDDKEARKLAGEMERLKQQRLKAAA